MNKEKVKAYCFNEGQPDQHYELRYAYDGAIIDSSPDNWKTYKCAVRWALHHGLDFVETVENDAEVV